VGGGDQARAADPRPAANAGETPASAAPATIVRRVISDIPSPLATKRCENARMAARHKRADMKRGLPSAYPGMRIGLFGGSFDPAHEGHAHVAETALKRLDLDRVWWLVSPQNPLKPKSSPLKNRTSSAAEHAHGAKMIVTDIEKQLNCAYTYQTLRALKRLYPGVHFYLVMGADNLANFRKWRNWREVAAAVPVIVVSRPGVRAAERLRAPKDWIFLSARHHRQSSTALREKKRPAVAKPKRK
jgi:nicotinate-nucleotide adenylyltransferase